MLLLLEPASSALKIVLHAARLEKTNAIQIVAALAT
jgi:hypothetical protein